MVIYHCLNGLMKTFLIDIQKNNFKTIIAQDTLHHLEPCKKGIQIIKICWQKRTVYSC